MYDFKLIEQEARKLWDVHRGEIEKALQNDPSKKLFSFLEGPPTANAPPGLHHLEVRTFKDIICKFKYMQGFSVPRKGGWDCHGLPVEVQVEKKLGLKDKKDIINYGVDKFIQQSRDSVFSNIKDWNVSTEELAYWIDLKNPYVTLDNNYIESVWWSLKELHKKELLYEGHKVVPFCTRCGTPLSSHEVAQGYKDVEEESAYVAFKLKNEENSYILAWTTTPWTLPGNVALAVGKDIDYVKVELEDKDKLIIAKEKLDLIKGKYEILKDLKGKDLEGLEYEPLFNIPELKNDNSHKVVLADFVTTEDGTGVVHTAVMYGEEDYNLGLKIGLPAVHTVGEDGKFLDIVKDFSGKYVKSAEKEIKENLQKRHLLFKKEKTLHSYPFCWRCDTPLLYYGINSWFIATSKIKDRMVELNQEINWYPSHIKDGRFGKWLENVKDWALSRFKFWGTPLPVWKNIEDEKDIIVVGSVEELKDLSGQELKDLHKPEIDKVIIKKDGKEYHRVKDVIDCWYDSGSASFAQFHYPFENKEEFEKRFPYDFIGEAIDQTRGWFYTLHAISSALFDKPAYKNVICAGHVVDEKGEKMSKSKGNIISPKEMIEKSGVDSIRLQFCTSNVGNPKRFSYELMKESVIPFLTVLYNCASYYDQVQDKKNDEQIEDRWILSKLNSLIKEVTEDLENYSLEDSFEKIRNFVVNDFSRGYIKLTRDREDTKEILKEVLEKVSLILAPFAPYISENVYQRFSKESVHLGHWPKIDKNKIDVELESRMQFALEIIEAGLRERDKSGIGLKWPLSEAKVYSKNMKDIQGIEEIIKSQLNIKNVVLKNDPSKELDLSVEFDTEITPDLEAEGFARNISRAVQALRKKSGLVKENEINLGIFTNRDMVDSLLLNGQEKLIGERTNSNKVIIAFDETEIEQLGKLNEMDNEEFEVKGKTFHLYIKKIN